MTRRDGWLGAADGMRVYWQAWEPDSEPRDTVILVHGAAEHGGRYGHVAERLAREGYAVYALDHRGHGRSNGTRAMIDRLDQLVDDLGLFIARVGGRPFLVGHSMGGAVALTYAIRHGDTISGLVVSGPAVATEAVPAPLKAITALLSKLAPNLPVFKIEDDAVSRDPQVVRDYQNDPLNHPASCRRARSARSCAGWTRCRATRSRCACRCCSCTAATIACARPRAVASSTPTPARRTRR
jgi:alpha-beta hydrolase superfamily lysophospholipase